MHHLDFVQSSYTTAKKRPMNRSLRAEFEAMSQDEEKGSKKQGKF